MSRLEETENSNEWIEEAISKKHIKYYEYKCFHNFKEIGSGSSGKVYRASWKSHRYLALKSFSNNDNDVKEIVHEVIMINIYFNLQNIYGILLKILFTV